MAKIEVYTTERCPWCIRAKMLLQSKNVKFDEIRVDLDPAKKDEMLKRSNGRKTVPEIFINDQLIGGFDELWDLEQKKQLDDLLK